MLPRIVPFIHSCRKDGKLIVRFSTATTSTSTMEGESLSIMKLVRVAPPLPLNRGAANRVGHGRATSFFDGRSGEAHCWGKLEGVCVNNRGDGRGEEEEEEELGK